MSTPEAVVVGGGAVGLCLASRLATAGVAVRLVVRRPETAAALARGGVVAEHARSGEERRAPVEARVWPDGVADAPALLLCTRREQAGALAPELAARAPEAPVVTFQNDVTSEAEVARHAATVVGGVWRETCTRLGEGRVRHLFGKPGRAVLGLHPAGRDARVEALAVLLRRGGIDVGVSERIAADKWLKLCVNLTSTPNALVRRADHRSAAFVEVKVRLLEEAREALAAAGIPARSCDGRDRSVDEEIARHRRSLREGTSVRELPLYNQVWASLRCGRGLEADGYHRRVLALAEAHALPAPVNARVLERLLEAFRRGRGPECLAASELLPG